MKIAGSRSVRVASSGVALALASLLLAACEPCAGVASCRVAPTVSANGVVIEYASGRPVAGVTLEYTPRSGAALGEPLRTTTDAAGRFHLSGEAVAEGQVLGDLAVRSPAYAPGYVVRSLALHASRVAGEGIDLGRVLERPWFAFLGEVRLRRSGAATTSTVRIERVAGASLTENVITVKTDPGGLFYVERPASDAEPVIADVTLTSPGQPRPFRYAGVSLPVIWRDRVPSVNAVYSLGASLAYAGEAFHRGLDRPVAGVRFSYRRTGGLATTPDSLSGVSNEIGLFSLKTEPSGDGEVIGDIELVPPAPATPVSVRGVRMKTFDTDEVRLLGSYRFGAAARYAGELFNRATGQLQPGVEVEFRPTGGVAAQPRATVSNAAGRFLIAPYTDQVGEIVGDLYVKYQPPRAAEVIAGVRLRTWEDDSLRYLQRWGVGPSLLWVGELRRDDTNDPIVGAQVTFRRTGGIAATPEVLNFTSIAGGRFSLNLAPSTDGAVQGTVSVHAPPLRDTTFAITLPTFNSDEVRLLAVWRIRP